jgi:hypothetical protein
VPFQPEDTPPLIWTCPSHMMRVKPWGFPISTPPESAWHASLSHRPQSEGSTIRWTPT